MPTQVKISKAPNNLLAPKQLPQVTDHLNEFVSQLLSHIADESPEGLKKLTNAMTQAKSSYKTPKKSWVTGWFFNRKRGPEIEQAITEINAFPDGAARLKTLKALVEKKGKWAKNSSYNYYLFVRLILLVPGYQPVTDELIHSVVLLVKNKILEKIDAFIADHQVFLKLKASQKKAIEPLKKPVLDHVLLSNNMEAAQTSAKQNPAKIQFSLFLKGKIWQVFWIDLNGKAYALTPGKKLRELLEKVENVLAVTAVLAQELKQECLAERDVFLGKIKLSINPENAAKLNSTFILKGAAKVYTLDWVDSLGKVKKIALEAHPQLKAWLATQDVLTEAQSSQIKSYLININTSQSIQVTDTLKSKLNARISGTFEAPKLVALKPVRKLNLSLFADVERCLGGRNASVGSPKSIASEEDVGTELISLPPAPKARSRRLTADQYAAVSRLFSPEVGGDVAGDALVSGNGMTKG